MICTNQNDNYILEQDKTIWLATLDNNQQVIQDDDRPELPERSAWKRLKQYLQTNKLHITGMHFKFRSHIVPLPKSDEGYYFSKGSGAYIGGESKEYYIYGYVLNGSLIKVWYMTPELVTNKMLQTIEPMNLYYKHINYIR